MTAPLPSPDQSDVLLQAVGIAKAFPGVKALDGVNITVRRGRLNALLGENGAGKSTMMNILAGVFPPDAGTMMMEGKPVSFKNTREAQAAGIAIIFQELNLIPELSIAENIFIGREPLNRFGLVDFARMNREAAALLKELELDADPRTLVSKLRVGAQQVVEIAKAMSFNSRVIIMDEPTSAITEHEIDVLFRLIKRLKQNGVGLIYITHKLDELPQIADDITVFRDGKFVGTKEFCEVSRDEMIRMMVGRELADLFPKTATTPGDEVLRVRNVSLQHAERAGDFAVKDVSFEVRRGEVLGIFGLMGAGRTELLQTIFGLYPKTSTGEIQVAGVPVKIHSPQDAIAAGLALAPEDRKADGVVLGLSIAHNTTLSCLPKIERMGLLQPQLERELVGNYVERLRVKTPSIHQAVVNLSGGNQQKVVLAKWLATKPKVLLLDEPTRGIDINAKKEIYTLIDELAQSGLAVVMVSSELPEILGIADRIMVLCEGRKTAEFSRAEATEEKVVKAALPVGVNN
ncbi:MAG TPA: sugar ABC transporter ATP-binding protein [bacterium]|nr:sugar ABC transporter ATP-binding protein [bacterium]